MANSKRDEFLYGTFPPGFVWATATASYQIEGAWNKDGKGENIWDRFCHQGDHVFNNDSGDIACDSYHKYEEDIQLMKNLGTSHYRFSISWARLMPKGTKEEINEAGIAFYDGFITALKTAGIEPMVTLYHWDLPQALQDIGGWENEELVEHFNDYARLCYQRFGDRVKLWITFNEPYVFTFEGYGCGIHAPGVIEPAQKPYIVSRVVLKAHAKAYHTYKDEFRDTQNGKVGITNNSDWREPKDATNQSDVTAAERSMQFFLGWFANAVFGDGGYPREMREAVDRKSREGGLEKSRLPEFTAEEKAYIKGTADFFGLNYYTTRYVEHEDHGAETQSYATDSDVNVSTDPEWKRGQSVWLYSAPWGLRKLLNWIRLRYNNPPLYITENGWSDAGTMEDTDRIDYYRKHINETLKAVRLDGCDVRGYTAWSLIDNFEWAMGYSEKFGLHQVDFNDPKRTRKAKASAAFFTQVVKDNGFPEGKPKL